MVKRKAKMVVIRKGKKRKDDQVQVIEQGQAQGEQPSAQQMRAQTKLPRANIRITPKMPRLR